MQTDDVTPAVEGLPLVLDDPVVDRAPADGSATLPSQAVSGASPATTLPDEAEDVPELDDVGVGFSLLEAETASEDEPSVRVVSAQTKKVDVQLRHDVCATSSQDSISQPTSLQFTSQPEQDELSVQTVTARTSSQDSTRAKVTLAQQVEWPPLRDVFATMSQESVSQATTLHCTSQPATSVCMAVDGTSHATDSVSLDLCPVGDLGVVNPDFHEESSVISLSDADPTIDEELPMQCVSVRSSEVQSPHHVSDDVCMSRPTEDSPVTRAKHLAEHAEAKFFHGVGAAPHQDSSPEMATLCKTSRAEKCAAAASEFEGGDGVSHATECIPQEPNPVGDLHNDDETHERGRRGRGRGCQRGHGGRGRKRGANKFVDKMSSALAAVHGGQVKSQYFEDAKAETDTSRESSSVVLSPPAFAKCARGELWLTPEECQQVMAEWTSLGVSGRVLPTLRPASGRESRTRRLPCSWVRDTLAHQEGANMSRAPASLPTHARREVSDAELPVTPKSARLLATPVSGPSFASPAPNKETGKITTTASPKVVRSASAPGERKVKRLSVLPSVQRAASGVQSLRTAPCARRLALVCATETEGEAHAAAELPLRVDAEHVGSEPSTSKPSKKRRLESRDASGRKVLQKPSVSSVEEAPNPGLDRAACPVLKDKVSQILAANQEVAALESVNDSILDAMLEDLRARVVALNEQRQFLQQLRNPVERSGPDAGSETAAPLKRSLSAQEVLHTHRWPPDILKARIADLNLPEPPLKETVLSTASVPRGTSRKLRVRSESGTSDVAKRAPSAGEAPRRASVSRAPHT